MEQLPVLEGRIWIVGTPFGIYLYDAARQWETIGFFPDVTSFTLSPDETILATAYEDASVRLWGLADGKLRRTLEHSLGRPKVSFEISPEFMDNFLDFYLPIGAMAFSADGQTLAVAYRDGLTAVWQIEDGTLRYALEHAVVPASEALAHSPDGRYLAAVGIQGSPLTVWRLADGKLLWAIPNAGWLPANRMPKLSPFSPDGNLLASVSRGGIVMLRKSADGTLVLRLGTGLDYVDQVGFTPDGTILVILSSRSSGDEGWQPVSQFRRVSDGSLLRDDEVPQDQVQFLDLESAGLPVPFDNDPIAEDPLAAASQGCLAVFPAEGSEQDINSWIGLYLETLFREVLGKEPPSESYVAFIQSSMCVVVLYRDPTSGEAFLIYETEDGFVRVVSDIPFPTGNPEGSASCLEGDPDPSCSTTMDNLYESVDAAASQDCLAVFPSEGSEEEINSWIGPYLDTLFQEALGMEQPSQGNEVFVLSSNCLVVLYRDPSSGEVSLIYETKDGFVKVASDIPFPTGNPEGVASCPEGDPDPSCPTTGSELPAPSENYPIEGGQPAADSCGIPSEGHICGLEGIRLTSDLDVLVWGSQGFDIFWWRIPEGTVASEPLAEGALVRADLSTDGRTALVCSAAGIELADLSNNSRTAVPGRCQHGGAALIPGTTTIVTWESNRIQQLSIPDGQVVGAFQGHQQAVSQVVVSEDGIWMASGSGDTTQDAYRRPSEIIIWNLGTRSRVRTLNWWGTVDSLAFSSDAALLAAASSSGTVRIWRVADGWLLKTLETTGQALAFSPDGNLLATGDWDGSIRLWSVPDGSELILLSGHAEEIVGLAFSPDGTGLVSASADGTVRLWGVK
jgi:WD40 repeat protein